MSFEYMKRFLKEKTDKENNILNLKPICTFSGKEALEIKILHDIVYETNGRKASLMRMWNKIIELMGDKDLPTNDDMTIVHHTISVQIWDTEVLNRYKNNY